MNMGHPETPPEGSTFACYVKRYKRPDDTYYHDFPEDRTWQAGPSYTNGLSGAENEEWIFYTSDGTTFYHYPPGTSSGADGWMLD